jgi:hypothetical protein
MNGEKILETQGYDAVQIFIFVDVSGERQPYRYRIHIERLVFQ